ncbi:MAG: hypothetical protein Q8L48_41390 [Archangium sp.]|nr:hypothetical protein [Archangium sp.]
MPALIIIIASVAGLAWLSAAVHAIWLVAYRRPDVTVGQLVLGGFRFFSAATFTEAGRPLQRRFVLSALVFAGCVLASIAAGFVASRG